MTINVSLAEVTAFEQQWSPSDPGHRITEAVAHVKGGWVASFTEGHKGRFGGAVMLAVERNGCNIRRNGKLLDDLGGVGKALDGENYTDLEQRRPADENTVVPQDRFEDISFRLAESNCNDGRGVDGDHLGRPCSS